MIIKKKYTTLKKQIEDVQVIEPPVNLEHVLNELPKEVEEIKNEEVKEEIHQVEPQLKEEKITPKKKKNDDLDLTLDNIKFEQREERREGTRRRGYRRTQDRNIVSRAQQDAESIKEVAKTEIKYILAPHAIPIPAVAQTPAAVVSPCTIFFL